MGWWVKRGDNVAGPFEDDAVIEALGLGALDMRVRRSEEDAWQDPCEVPRFADHVARISMPPAPSLPPPEPRWWVKTSTWQGGPYVANDVVASIRRGLLPMWISMDGYNWQSVFDAPQFAQIASTQERSRRSAERVNRIAGLLVTLIGIVMFLVWCDRRTKEALQTPALPIATSPEVVERETITAIRESNPTFCSAAMAEAKWATCHDETKGFDATLACAQHYASVAGAAKAGWTTRTYGVACAISVETAAHEATTAYALHSAGVLAFLQKNEPLLRRKLAGHTLTDVCGELDCGKLGEPLPAPGLHMPDVECTKPLFVCGERDNVCWHNKVAARIGVACDPQENKPTSPLLGKASGERLN